MDLLASFLSSLLGRPGEKNSNGSSGDRACIGKACATLDAMALLQGACQDSDRPVRLHAWQTIARLRSLGHDGVEHASESSAVPQPLADVRATLLAVTQSQLDAQLMKHSTEGTYGSVDYNFPAEGQLECTIDCY